MGSSTTDDSNSRRTAYALLVSKLSTATKRLLLGRPFRSDKLGHTLLPKRIALPVFASDAMSSVAYAPEEIFLVLSVAGISAYAYTPWIGLSVAIVMAVVVASYRQNVHAYPSGGGDYEVATVNLGPTAGLTVGSALMVDYVLTVAVSISSAASNIGSALPFVAQHKVLFAVVAIVLLTAVNLRGIRESGTAFAIPTYAFIVGMFLMLGWGFFRIFVLGDDVKAESSSFTLDAEDTHLYGLAFAFLIARAFSSGCAALTGVEAISNGVPAFEKPKSRNAATTLLLLGTIAITLLMGIIMLAQKIGIVYRAQSRGAVGRSAGGLPPEDSDRADRRGGVQRLPDRVLLHCDRDGADPGFGGQHRFQRFPGSRVDPRAGPLPASSVAHPR